MRIQFLAEALALTLLGGVIGILLSVVACAGLADALGWNIAISLSACIVAFASAFVVGLFFGSYPAWRAARLSPIEALRYE